MTTHEKIDQRRAIADLVRGQVDRAAELVVHESLFARLVVEHLGIASRLPDGGLAGIGHYGVYYCPLAEWADAAASQAVGEWVYGEWSERKVQKPLETGGFLTGSRIVLALGRATKAGNGTAVSLQRLAVGLIEEAHGEFHGIHFVGAVNMSGLRHVVGACPEEEFYSAVTGFINSRGDKAVPAFYPLKKGGRA